MLHRALEAREALEAPPQGLSVPALGAAQQRPPSQWPSLQSKRLLNRIPSRYRSNRRGLGAPPRPSPMHPLRRQSRKARLKRRVRACVRRRKGLQRQMPRVYRLLAPTRIPRLQPRAAKAKARRSPPTTVLQGHAQRRRLSNQDLKLPRVRQKKRRRKRQHAQPNDDQMQLLDCRSVDSSVKNCRLASPKGLFPPTCSLSTPYAPNGRLKIQTCR